jgi:hypothetical protein
MCRNIKTLSNFEPPVAGEEINAASLQYVRKLTGFNKPSKINEAAFYSAVEDNASISERLLASLETIAAPKDREVEEAAKAKVRSALRFGGCRSASRFAYCKHYEGCWIKGEHGGSEYEIWGVYLAFSVGSALRGCNQPYRRPRVRGGGVDRLGPAKPPRLLYAEKG